MEAVKFQESVTSKHLIFIRHFWEFSAILCELLHKSCHCRPHWASWIQSV